MPSLINYSSFDFGFVSPFNKKRINKNHSTLFKEFYLMKNYKTTISRCCCSAYSFPLIHHLWIDNQQPLRPNKRKRPVTQEKGWRIFFLSVLYQKGKDVIYIYKTGWNYILRYTAAEAAGFSKRKGGGKTWQKKFSLFFFLPPTVRDSWRSHGCCILRYTDNYVCCCARAQHGHLSGEVKNQQSEHSKLQLAIKETN